MLKELLDGVWGKKIREQRRKKEKREKFSNPNIHFGFEKQEPQAPVIFIFIYFFPFLLFIIYYSLLPSLFPVLIPN